jgi:hypothetical protein
VTGTAAAFVARLDAVVPRLEAHARGPRPGLTEPDPRTGDRWDPGQVWAHVAEFIPYWIGEVRRVVAAAAAGSDPAAFGRTRSDPRRVGEIERRRDEGPAALMATVRGEAARLREVLAGLDGPAWAARGLHPTLGVLPLAEIVEHFLVGHLEEHADQLDGLVATPPGGDLPDSEGRQRATPSPGEQGEEPCPTP